MSNITLIFSYAGNNLSLQCQSNETLEAVYRRFCTKVDRNIGDFKFYYNSMEVPPCNKTLSNLNLQNFNQFNVVENNVVGA